MILHLYFARRFLVLLLQLTAVFAIMLFLIDLIEQVRLFSRNDVPFSRIVLLTLLNTPQTLQPFLPQVVSLGTVALFIGLARSSELVVVRASGRAALITLLAPVTVAFLAGVFMTTTYDPMVAGTTKRYEAMTADLVRDGTSALSVTGEGLWLRQGDPSGQTVIHAARSNAEATELFGVTFIAYAHDSGPISRVEARSARLEEGAWVLQNAKVWPLATGINPEINAVRHDTLRLPTTLDRQRILASFARPGAIPIWDLPGFIAQLEQAGFSSRRHLVWMHMEITQPLFLVALVLIASALTMRPVRSGRVGLAVLTVVMMGFALHYIRDLARILGESGQIPYLLAAWAPPVAAVMLAMGLLLHMEDG